jgi:DNA-directed RNA polymerase subunit RPC12/RpoP
VALVNCPACSKDVSDQASACPSCGHPLKVPVHFEGPPKNCSNCGGPLKSGKDAKSEGTGCLIVILGLVFTPVLVGIPILLYGLNLMGKREGYWRCRQCGAKFPREIKWYELG